MQITFSQHITGKLIPQPCVDGEAVRDEQIEIQLNGNDVFRLEKLGSPLTIRGLDGVLWVTQEGDPADYMLQAGQAVALQPGGTVVVQALGCGRMQIVNS